MRSFRVEGSSPEQFVERVTKALADGGLAAYATVRLDGDRIVATMRWFGTSELRYRVLREGDGFRAVHSDQRMSALHAPFRRGFDDRFEQLLAEVGAKLE